MTGKEDVRSFLVSRRANVTPVQAGLPDLGGERRVPGLRREEVAELAGVSLDYYTRLERGQIRGASDSVLHAIADALRLDDVERAHLFDLARAAEASRRAGAADRAAAPAARLEARPSIRRVLDTIGTPAIVYNARQDIVAANALGEAFFSEALEDERPNLARYVFLDSRARRFFGDWELACALNAAMLRYEAGRDPLDADLTAMIGELAARSPVFREHWADHDVHEHRNGTKTFTHPAVGEVELHYDVFEMPGEPGLALTVYTADEGSVSAERLTLLGAWAGGPASEGDPRS